MIEKIKRRKKIDTQDKQQPQTIKDLIRRYDLDNNKEDDYLDYLVDYLNDLFVRSPETITNENGTAIKFPDGTMMCYLKNKITRENQLYTEFTLPANYIDQNYASFATSCYGHNSDIIFAITNPAVSQVRVYPRTNSGAVPTGTENVNIFTIGRWKT